MLVTRLLSLLPCLLIVQFADLENANVVLNIIQFIQLPFIILPAIRFISDKDLAETEVYQGAKLYLLLLFSGLLILMNLYQLTSNLPESDYGKAFAFVGLATYLGFLAHIAGCRLSPLPQHMRQVPNGGDLRDD